MFHEKRSSLDILDHIERGVPIFVGDVDVSAWEHLLETQAESLNRAYRVLLDILICLAAHTMRQRA